MRSRLLIVPGTPEGSSSPVLSPDVNVAELLLQPAELLTVRSGDGEILLS